jgi:D-3-phosphoglycerate dehydrogenase
MATVLVTHPADRLREYFGDEALARLRRIAQVRLNPSNADLTGPALVQAVQGCQVMIAYRQTSLDAVTLQAMPELLAVVRCAVDIRTIDVPAASGQRILVTQASAGFMASVSEWILAAMIDLSRGISRAAAAYSAGRQPVPQMGRELRGATLGVIGYGQISRYLCPLATAFGLRVLVNDPFLPAHETAVRSTDLADLLAQSDYVVCLAPANAETENLMNAAAFARMKQGAFFVNASRGNLVDDAALLDALNSGHLAGAALDVGRAPDQMPSLALASHPRVLASPHIGGLTLPAIQHQALETVAQTDSILRGQVPVGAVNADAAHRLANLKTAAKV